MALLRSSTLATESHIGPAVPLPYSSDRRVLWSVDHPVSCELVGGSAADELFFQDILNVRQMTDHRWPDQRTEADTYSDHYCLYIGGAPIGSLGVTRALHGPVFLEEFYPEPMFDDFRDRIVSAYRFRLLPEFRKTSLLSRGLNLAYSTIRETWREHLAKGAGIDVINVEPKYIPYYRRLGYVRCEGYDFICPVFHEPIAVMFLPADPTRNSVIHDLIQDRDDHVFLDDVLASLSRSQVYIRKQSI